MSEPAASPSTEEDAPVTATESAPADTYVNYLQESGVFELPISGASGYASVSLRLYTDQSADANVIATLNAGQGFTILEESGDWWQIALDEKQGWVKHQYCLINLPDVIPSIIYDNTNSYASIMKSSEKDIPNITGQALYQAKMYSARFDAEVYVVPVLYEMAKKIGAAQQAALAEGDTLIIYEAFRPYDVQQSIAGNLRALMNADPLVEEGVTRSPWSMGWFIVTGISNHQRGAAIDVSLGKVVTRETRACGGYEYTAIREYSEYFMPTAMHELSAAAAIFLSPVSSNSATAWLDAEPAETMNREALLLQTYCTNAGLTPLASEWWHFNDLESRESAVNSGSVGKYFVQQNYSAVPFF
ncbi:MAG: SH3 domain-containing protein [Oscillospiraceae bacterium]|nr:SH3 domain-containing protein [Oscillospiraceae bacterium]